VRTRIALKPVVIFSPRTFHTLDDNFCNRVCTARSFLLRVCSASLGQIVLTTKCGVWN